LSILEAAALNLRTTKEYHQAAELLVSFCTMRGLNWNTAAELDTVLVAFFTVLYEEGFSKGMGLKVISALNYLIPALIPHRAQSLPRAHRAIKGWGKLRPTGQRLPLPRFAALAIAAHMINLGQPSMALWIMLVFSGYLRPSEAMRLTRSSLVPPTRNVCEMWGLIISDWYQGVAGKTGIFDESVLLIDQFLYPCLMALWVSKKPSESLWNFSVHSLRQTFLSCSTRLGLGSLACHLYCLRHGGASHDLLTRRLSVLEVQRKGRWQSPNSLKRYAKETRLLSEIGKLNPLLIAHAQIVETHFTSLITGERVLATPSLSLTGAPTSVKRKLVRKALRLRKPTPKRSGPA